MRQSLRVTVTLPSSIARRLYDEERSLSERQGLLCDLLFDGGKWYTGSTKRHGFVAVGVLCILPETAARFLVLADTPRRRRVILRALACWDSLTFCSAAPALPDAPPAAVEGVPLDLVWKVQEDADALARDYAPDIRIHRVDAAQSREAQCEAV